MPTNPYYRTQPYSPYGAPPSAMTFGPGGSRTAPGGTDPFVFNTPAARYFQSLQPDPERLKQYSEAATPQDFYRLHRQLYQEHSAARANPMKANALRPYFQALEKSPGGRAWYDIFPRRSPQSLNPKSWHRDTKIALAKFLAMAAGGYALAGAGGAGAAAGGGGAGGSAAAGTVNPFLADAGLGTTWTSVGAGGAGLTTGLGGGGGGGYYDPSGTFHAGVSGGDFGAAPAGGNWWQNLFRGGGGDSWGQFGVHEGLGVVTNYLGARQQAEQARRQQEALKRQRAETLGFASPEAYTQNYERYLEEFKDAYRPWLTTEADRAAIGEQTASQAFETDLARRGLSGSGLALAGQSAIRTGRQAQLNENMRRYRQMWEEAARDAASGTRSAQISASVGAPYAYVPRPSPGVAAVQGLGDAYRDWLWLQGTQNNPFVSMKDQRYYR